MADEGAKEKRKDKNKISTERNESKRAKKVEEDRRNAQLKTMEASIRSQVAAEQKAHEIVEELVLDEHITPERFMEIGNYIGLSHYSDVVDERSIAKVCGYPLCNNPLINVPKQKYKISMRTNRVYDITERKCYCSNDCYKASKFYESQLSTAPVWTHIGKDLKQFSLLPAGDVKFMCSSGQIMIGSESQQADEANSLSRGEGHHHADQEEPINTKSVEECQANGEPQTKDSMDSLTADVQQLTVTHLPPGRENILETHNIEIKERILDHKTPGDTPPIDQSAPGDTPPIDQSAASKSLNKNTIEEDNIEVTYNNESLSTRPEQNQKATNSFNNKDSSTHSDSITSNRTESSSVIASAVSENESSLPKDVFLNSVLDILRQWFTKATLDFIWAENHEGKTSPEKGQKMLTFEEKALQFFKRNPETGDDDNDDDDDDDDDQEENRRKIDQNKGVPRVVPPIDNKSQSAIRTKIVLQTLTRRLPEVLAELGLTMSDVSTDLTNLVRTFRLDSHNTMANTLQWKVIAFSLVNLLRHRNGIISRNLRSSTNYGETLAGSLGLAQGELVSFTLKIEEQFRVAAQPKLKDSNQAESLKVTSENSEDDLSDRADDENFSHMEDLD